MSDDPVSITSDGQIAWRGFYKSPEDAAKLAAHFETIQPDDWFYPTAQSYAIALREAIQTQADEYAE